MQRQRWHVLYHWPCADGVFAIWAIHLARLPHEITYQAHSTTMALRVADLPAADRLLLVDYCGPSLEWLLECCGRYREVSLLDHHKTGYEIAMRAGAPDPLSGKIIAQGPPNLQVRIRQNMSACTLVVREFEVELTERQNLLFMLVQDHDLYTHLHPHSKEFSDALAARRIQYDVAQNPALFEQLSQLIPEELFAEGIEVKKRNDRLVQQYKQQAFVKHIGESRVLCVMIAESDNAIISQLGNELAQLCPEHLGAACIQYPELDRVHIKIRSIAPVDCEVIAKAHGGGGHAQASGFIVTYAQWQAMQ